jgi:hypothetical protein
MRLAAFVRFGVVASCLMASPFVFHARAADLLYVSARNNPVIQTYSLDLQTTGTFVDLSADQLYEFTEFNGIGFDGAQNLYAVHQPSGSILKFNSSGSLVTGSFVTGLTNPGALAVAANGDLLIVDNGFGTGSAVSKWTAATSTLNSTFITGLDNALSAIFGHDGNVLVSLSGTTNAVAKYSASGILQDATFIKDAELPNVTSVILSGTTYLVGGNQDPGFEAVVYSFPLTGGTNGTVRVGVQASANQQPNGRYFDTTLDGSLYNFAPGQAEILQYDAGGTFVRAALSSGGDVNYGVVHDINAVPEPSMLAAAAVAFVAVTLVRRGRSR